jgi:hypothetical protein
MGLELRRCRRRGGLFTGGVDELRNKGVCKSAIGAGDEHAPLYSKDSCYFECLYM